MSLPALFASSGALRQGFAQGLEDMLADHDEPGVYVLALANAAYQPELWPHLRPALERRHARHAGEISAALRAGRRVPGPEDDVLVCLKLMAMGFDHVHGLQRRSSGPWRMQFNPIRALRPARASHARFAGLHQPFDAHGFHFERPHLARETLWQGELAGKPARLLYNKFPFAPWHGVLVPEPAARQPQYLTPALHAWAWQVTQQMAPTLPDFGLAYNSLGACASVNHLHFQTFLQAPELPLLSARFQHQGGATPYPLPCRVADDCASGWRMLDALHQAGMPYNLIYTPARLFILARRPQHEQPAPNWSAGLGWSELAGVMTLFNREDFQTLDGAHLQAALAALAP